MPILLPVEYDIERGCNVEFGDTLHIVIDGVEVKCKCLGWRMISPSISDAIEIKTDLLGDFGNQAFPMEQVRVVANRRERRLMAQVADLQNQLNLLLAQFHVSQPPEGKGS